MADNRDICERLEAVAGFGGTHLDGIWSEAAKEIRSLHYYVARLEEDLASADLEIEGLRKYSSKQALDIVTLGQEVGRLREDLQVQANAVRMLDQCRDTEISHLRQTHQQAKTAAQTLDSEREANSLLTVENERLREALENIAALDVPRPVMTRYRTDGIPSKYDRCAHLIPMWDDCARCISDYARAALAEKEKK